MPHPWISLHFLVVYATCSAHGELKNIQKLSGKQEFR